MRKLCAVALGFASALLLANYVLPGAALPRWAAGLVLACALALFLRGNGRLRLLLVCFSAAVGLGWYWGCDALFIEPAEALAGQTLTVTACVADYPVYDDNFSSVSVRLTSEGLPTALTALYDYQGLMPALEPGDIIEAEVKFSSATVRAGQETDSFVAKGVSSVAYLRERPEVVGRSALAFLYFPRTISKAIRETVDIIFPADTAAYMKGMLIGDKTGLNADDELYVALSRAGILHVAAVSGMHLAFIYGCVRLLARSRRRAAAIAIPLLWVFALVAGASPSAIRAAIMLTLVILAPFLRRETDGPTSLCAALLPLLVVNPFAIASASLQLSFSAMAGIILVSPRVYDWCAGVWKAPKKGKGRFRRAVIAGFASSIGAMVFVTPVAALHFDYVSLVSPLSFLMTLWALSACFLGGYGAVLLGLIWPPLGECAAWLVSWLARYIILVCKGLSALSFAAVYTSDELIAWWLLFTYAVFVFAYLRRGKAPFRPIVPLCASICVLCAVMGLNTLFYRSEDTATVLDVGQGQSVALFSGRATVLVDCGGSGGDAGDAAADYLDTHGRARVDALVLTHLHRDHAGGVARLLARTRVDYLLLPADASDEDGLLAGIERTARRQGTEIVYVAEDTAVSVGSIYLTLFAPMDAGDANERGLIVLATVGDWDMLMTGDVNASVEKRLAERNVLPDCEALVVGHHGSKNSTSLELLTAARAETAVISVGFNTYGHPTPETLDLLARFGMDIYRTDTDGNIELRIR